MNRTRQGQTTNVRTRGSRTPADRDIIRAQFERLLDRAMAEAIPDDIDTARGDRIRELAGVRFATLTALAKEIDATPKSVGRWCAGQGVGRQFRQPLADALGTTWEYLATGETHMPPVHDVMKRLDQIEDKINEIIASLVEQDADDADQPGEGSGGASESDAPDQPGPTPPG